MGMQVGPKNVVGRDELIRQIWDQLRKLPNEGSVRFTAERRIGKTTVMTKMAAEPEDDFDVLFLEVEGIDSCDRLTELLLNRIQPLLSKTEKAQTWFKGFWTNLGGTEIGGVIKLPENSKLGWRETLERAIEGLCQNHPARLVLLMFDEIPYMLQKIDAVSTKVGMPHEALTLLDTFRALRQRHHNLRMIFCGSVGLHHVLRDLRQSNLASEPVNNMPMIEIHPLDVDDALELAARLLDAEKIQFTDDQQQIAHRLADLTSNVPFYMERIAGQLGLLGRPITLADVNEVFLEQLTSDHDPWEMEHFRERLTIYYRGAITGANGSAILRDAIARSILDHLSVTDIPQSIDQVWSILKSQFALTDRQVAIQLLKSLGQDHYLICDTKKNYSFRFSLIKQWWKTAQGLDS